MVLCSPVYNWQTCGELKRLIEVTGSTDSSLGVRGAWFDKVIAFVNAAGLPHSYPAWLPLAGSMMLDFKCIVSPYNVYVHDRHWTEGDRLGSEAGTRMEKAMAVLLELTVALAARNYRSGWEI